MRDVGGQRAGRMVVKGKTAPRYIQDSYLACVLQDRTVAEMNVRK